jgi:hypothetical protein
LGIGDWGMRVRCSLSVVRCPSAAGYPGYPLAGRGSAARALQAELAQAVVNGGLGIALAEVEARLAVCRGCGEFRGMGCRSFSARYVPCRAWFWALVAAPGRAVEQCQRWAENQG